MFEKPVYLPVLKMDSSGNGAERRVKAASVRRRSDNWSKRASSPGEPCSTGTGQPVKIKAQKNSLMTVPGQSYWPQNPCRSCAPSLLTSFMSAYMTMDGGDASTVSRDRMRPLPYLPWLSVI